MTKLLFLLVLAQTLLIALLYFKVDAVEQRVAQSAAAAPRAIDAARRLPGSAPAPAATVRGVDTAELRRIIREELQSVSLDWAAEQQQANAAARPVYDEVEMQRRREQVQSSLDYLKTQDEVSQAELDLLLADIARLDPERRSEAMKELNRAMNRGEIRGNL